MFVTINNIFLKNLNNPNRNYTLTKPLQDSSF